MSHHTHITTYDELGQMHNVSTFRNLISFQCVMLTQFLILTFSSVQVSSVTQSCPTLCNPMNHSMPGLLDITNSQSSLRLTSMESVMSSSHLILCRPLLLLPPIPLSIRAFSNESTLRMRWPKY